VVANEFGGSQKMVGTAFLNKVEMKNFSYEGPKGLDEETVK